LLLKGFLKHAKNGEDDHLTLKLGIISKRASQPTAYRAFRESQMTSKQAGYQSSNKNVAVDLHNTVISHHTTNNAAFDIQGTMNAIANLATASGQATAARLSETNTWPCFLS
jgi:hypothetical protein